ncbi:MAG: hypothetical protein NC311_06970 [Muribaculaceae bacterium]|nr:hypothetical protein [Muribaculaceae bacterium]MCM1398980.1 hypothetical protein [Clostridium sp.]MCM1458838.1 hypothetical protein [Bacteroides sp.]
MDVLYKRLITVGMISITCVLGWIYCIMEYRSQPIYIIVVSLALVVSVFAFLSTVTGLNNAKEANLKEYIDQTVITGFKALASGSEDAERLNKATYVQIRKIATTLKKMDEENAVLAARQEALIKEAADVSNHTTVQTINKAVKVLIKYNAVSTDKLIASVDKLDSDLDVLSELIEQCSESEKAAFASSINSLSDGITSIKNRVVSMSGKISEFSLSPAPAPEVPKDSLEIFDGEPDELPADIPDEEEDDGLVLATDDLPDDFDLPNSTEEDLTDESIADESQFISEIPEANVVPEASDIDIDSLFDEVAEPEIEPVTTPSIAVSSEEEAMNRSLEAMSEPVKAPEPAVITAPANDDMNKKMSPDEIAALFAAASTPASEPEPEPEPVAPAPISDDPNKQMSPDEIAALIASMQ